MRAVTHLLALLALAVASSSLSAAVTTELVSIRNSTSRDFDAEQVVISGDGRFIAFQTVVDQHLYVRDLLLARTQLVGRRSDGTAVRCAPWFTISADGRWIAFATEVALLPSTPARAGSHVYAFEIATGSLSAVSVDRDGMDSLGWDPAISADGRLIAFAGYGGLLQGTVDTSRYVLYLRDRIAGTTVEVAQRADGLAEISMSGDGAVVAFVDRPLDDHAGRIFAVDRRTGIERAMTPAGGVSQTPSVSHDGRYVVVNAEAELDPSQPPTSTYDVFMVETATAAARKVSVGPDGSGLDRVSVNSRQALTADNRYVVFTTWSPELAPSERGEVIVRDLATGAASRRSLSSAGLFIDNWTEHGVIAAYDHRLVAFLGISLTTYDPRDDAARNGQAAYLSQLETGGYRLRVNFQPSGAATPPGHYSDSGATFRTRGTYQFGWSATNATAVDWNSALSPDQRYDTHIRLPSASRWEAAVENGWYTVTAVAGDPATTSASYRVLVEGAPLIDGAQSSANRWIEGRRTVQVTDGRITITGSAAALCFLDVHRAPGPLGRNFSANVNFQPATAAPQPGYATDSGQPFGARSGGLAYGWNAANDTTRDRNHWTSYDQRHDTVIHLQKAANPDARWELTVPNGRYEVHVVAGDPIASDSWYRTLVEGTLLIDADRRGLDNGWIDGFDDVEVRDGRMTVENAPGAINNKLNYISILQLPSAPG